jgi:hypothetical protein
MGNTNENKVILSSLKFKTASNTDYIFSVPLVNTTKQNTEFDRTIDVSLADVFESERQTSTIFRPSCKFMVLFKNSYVGYSTYTPFKNNLFYINEKISALQNCPINESIIWSGYPQYNEFDFIRNDYNLTGYTQPPGEHILFTAKSASTYNWTFYLSYPFENNYNKQMSFYDNETQQTINWTCSSGIPFVITNSSLNGLNIIRFRCPMKHGLSVGEFVKLNILYNGVDLFQVDSLGDDYFGNSDYYFNIVNVGYTGTTFNDGVSGTFKRVILGDEQSDTTSKYYVRRHKILTNTTDSVLTKCGFEESVFGITKKYESKQYTPNKQSRVSIKEGGQSYTLSFNRDFDIYPLIDNQKRPISHFYFTVLWKGYFGWTGGAKQQGWEFNLPLLPSGQPTSWWDDTNSKSKTNLPLKNYTKSNWTPKFIYTDDLRSGSTIDGEYCEWNDYEQKERVISNLHHRFKFNNSNFKPVDSLGLGYYYKVHHPIKIRDFSDYIEEGSVKNVDDIPNYSYYSTNKNVFIWRDLYPYGFIDSEGIGTNFPFLNGTHYPYDNYIFRIIPEGTNYNYGYQITQQPTIDNCE